MCVNFVVITVMPTMGVGPTRLPGMGRAALRGCPALPGIFAYGPDRPRGPT